MEANAVSFITLHDAPRAILLSMGVGLPEQMTPESGTSRSPESGTRRSPKSGTSRSPGSGTSRSPAKEPPLSRGAIVWLETSDELGEDPFVPAAVVDHVGSALHVRSLSKNGRDINLVYLSGSDRVLDTGPYVRVNEAPSDRACA